MHSKYTEYNYYRGVSVIYIYNESSSETVHTYEISRSFKNDIVGLKHVKDVLLVHTRTVRITTTKRQDILQIEVTQSDNFLKFCKLAILPKPDDEDQEETFKFRRYESQPHDGYTFIASEIEIYTCLPSTNLSKFRNLATSERPYEALVDDQGEKIRFRRYEAQPHDGFLFIAGENDIYTCMPSTSQASERAAYINAVFGDQAARGGVDRNQTNEGVYASAEATGNETAENVETVTDEEEANGQNPTGGNDNCTDNSNTLGNDKNNNDEDKYLYEKKKKLKTKVFKKVIFVEFRDANPNSKSVKYIVNALTKTITCTTNDRVEELLLI